MDVRRPLVIALTTGALLALATIRLSKGELLSPPPTSSHVDVRPSRR
jgi:hypothetical protein